MRDLYKEFFYVPKHGKVTDKVMTTRVVTTVITMLICLITMSITAYAYFSHSVTSGIPTLQTATFEIAADITITDENNAPVEAITSNYRSYLATMEKGKTYKVTVSPIASEKAAKTGFVIVTASGSSERYHTRQLGQDGDTQVTELTFYLQVSETTEVTLQAHWGTSSYYPDYIADKAMNERMYITGNTVDTPILIDIQAPQTQTDETDETPAPPPAEPEAEEEPTAEPEQEQAEPPAEPEQEQAEPPAEAEPDAPVEETEPTTEEQA